MRKKAILILVCLFAFALPTYAAPLITVSGNSVTILGSAQTISLTCTLIDPNNTGNLRSGSNIITVFVTSTTTPGNVATCGPIYGNDVITDGYGNPNTTYYKVQVFTVSGGIVASTPSLQQFYAFTGSGTVDLSTATPLAPSFFTGPSGNVVVPGNLSVTGALNASGVTTNSGPLELNNNPCSASAISPQTELNKLPIANSSGDFGGGVLSFPCAPGYTVSAGLAVQNHGTHIRGGGFGTDFLASAAITGSDFLKVLAGGSYTFVRDFSDEDHIWDCNSVTALNGLHFQDFQDRGLVRNVTFRNCDGNEVKTDVLNTSINSHITWDGVITYPFKVKGSANSWNLVALEYGDWRHLKIYGNNGSGGKNTGPGFNCQGCNRSLLQSSAASLWNTAFQFTNNGAAGSDSNLLLNPSCENVLTTCMNFTGTGGAPATRNIIIGGSVPSPSPTNLINFDFATQNIFLGRDDACIPLTANSSNNFLIVNHVGCLPTDAGTNNLIVDANAGNLELLSNGGGNLILHGSAGAAAASQGALRLCSACSIGWRNNANSGDIILTHNASDQLNLGAGNGIVAVITAPLLPSVVGSTDIGAASSPYSNLWLGTAATNNFKFAPAATAAARTISMPDPLGNVLLGESLNTGTGVYQTGTGAGCTTAASIGGVCASPATVTFAASFADTNYKVSCSPNGAATNLPSTPYIVTKSVGSVTVNYFAITAAAASWPNVECVAVHN